MTTNSETPPATADRTAEKWRQSPHCDRLVRELAGGASARETLTEAFKAGVEKVTEGKG